MEPVEITIMTCPDTSELMAKKIIPAKPTKKVIDKLQKRG